MDVDESHLHKYDEYIRGPAREVITVETKIKPSNKGFSLLAKLGWVEGQPLGLSGDGTAIFMKNLSIVLMLPWS
jgi:hypothetical protein